MRLLIACLSLILAACGQSSQSASPPAAPSAPSTMGSNEPAEETRERIAALAAPYNEANYEAGRRAFAQCRSCHTIDEGAGNRVGPNLHGVFGREIGSVAGFTYSQPVQDANFVWTAEQLDHWLQNPQSFLPGNRMAFAGVRDATARRDLIAYLMVETAPD